MQRAILRTTAFAVALMAMASFAAADVPQLINYQGRLTDPAGDPVTDDDYNITFTIYDDPTGGIVQWTSGQQTVSVKDGLFHYQLGSMVQLQDTLFDDTLRWLGIKVGADPEVTPRARLTSVPYAYHALRADAGGGWKNVGDTVCLIDSMNLVGIGTCGPDAKLHAWTDQTHGTAVLGMSEGGTGDKRGGDFWAVEKGTYNVGVHAEAGKYYVDGEIASVSNIGIWARCNLSGAHTNPPPGEWAGYFSGDVKVTGDLTANGSIRFGFDYNSGWQEIDPGTANAITLYHGLGGDPSKYIVLLYGKNYSGGIHQANYGTSSAYFVGLGNKWYGCEWDKLTAGSIRVTRAPDDLDVAPEKWWEEFRVRIIKNQ